MEKRTLFGCANIRNQIMAVNFSCIYYCSCILNMKTNEKFRKILLLWYKLTIIYCSCEANYDSINITSKIIIADVILNCKLQLNIICNIIIL